MIDDPQRLILACGFQDECAIAEQAKPVPANASALGWLVVLAYLYAGGRGAATAFGGTGHGSGTGLAGSDVPDGPPNC